MEYRSDGVLDWWDNGKCRVRTLLFSRIQYSSVMETNNRNKNRGYQLDTLVIKESNVAYG